MPSADWNPSGQELLKLARMFAQPYKRHDEFDDIVMEIVVALLRAKARFDPGKGFTFPTYAQYAAKGAVNMWLKSNTRQQYPGLPEKSIQKLTKIAEAEETVYKETGRRATPEEVAKRCGISAKRVIECQVFVARRQCSRALSAHDVGMSEPDAALNAELKAVCTNFLKNLTKRDRIVFTMRMTPDPVRERTKGKRGKNKRASSRHTKYSEIAEAVGLSGENVRTICCRVRARFMQAARKAGYSPNDIGKYLTRTYFAAAPQKKKRKES